MKHLLATTAVLAALAGPLSAQTDTPPTPGDRPAGAEAFAPENAILNTAIPFAVGAREAQQSLRGAFGWATFQEGLAQGVYFRFDPDGYARFSPSPRLDTDVFEVLCRPRTYSCHARKGPLTMLLSDTGRLTLRVENAEPTDIYVLSDGLTELEVPARVNGELDTQMEALLASGTTLMARRNGDVVARGSLTGFSAVAAYLRWIAARQDYTVLPRDWPVPNGPSAPANGAVTAVQGWAAPAERQLSAQAAAANAAPPTPEMPATGTDELATLKAEVALLRDLLVAGNFGGNPGAGTPSALPPTPVTPATLANGLSATPQTSGTPSQLTQMAAAMPGATMTGAQTMTHTAAGAAAGPADTILAELEALRAELAGETPMNGGAMTGTMGMASPSTPPGTATLAASGQSMSEYGAGGSGAGLDMGGTSGALDRRMAAAAEVAHLQYLTSEMGFDGRTAIMILQLAHQTAGHDAMADPAHGAATSPSWPGGSTILPEQLLAELAAATTSVPMTATPALQMDSAMPAAQMAQPAEPASEYQLLTDYFRSEIMPAMQN